MAIVRHVMEMRGMRRTEITEYFTANYGACMEPGLYKSFEWQVEVGEERTVRMGSLCFPSTEVVFSGEEIALTTVLERFRLRFLSAGG